MKLALIVNQKKEDAESFQNIILQNLAGEKDSSGAVFK